MRRLLSSYGPGSSRVLLLAIGLLLSIAGFLSASAPALAEYSRPLITKATLKETPTGPFGEEVPFGPLGGCLAIDTGEGADSSGNIWVSEKDRGVINEFDALGEFLAQLPSPGTQSCAFDHQNGKLYTVGTKEWVAVDNSTGPDSGDIYHAAQGTTTTGGVVERTNDNGEPAIFTCSAPGSEEYIKNGDDLIGRPGEKGGPVELWPESQLEGIAVDSSNESSAGNIYVINRKNGVENGGMEIDEFASDGCFERAIKGTITKVNEKGEKEIEELFSIRLIGIAVDPTNGDVLVVSSGNETIVEFTSSGEYLGKITSASLKAQGQESGLFGEGSIAVSSEGHVYVDVQKTEQNEQGVETTASSVDVFGRGAFYPDAVTGEITNAHPQAVTLTGEVRGAVNNKKEALVIGACYFEYLTEKAFQESGFSKPEGQVQCALEDSSSPVGKRLSEVNYPVHADIENLKPGVVYRYRLVAATGTTVSERGGVREGAAESFASPDEPSVDGMSVDEVTSSYANLHAEVNPRGAATKYWFEYTDVAGMGRETPIVSIGSGDHDVSVAQQVSGLSPDTTYLVRVAAMNAVGTVFGAYESFTTLPATVQGLPDNRGYELVTPANKGDAEDLFGGSNGVNHDLGYSSGSGDDFLLWTTAAFGSFPTSGENLYVFGREKGAGWTATSTASPGLGVQTLVSAVFDPFDFSMVGLGEKYGSEPAAELAPVADLVGPPGGFQPGGQYETAATAMGPVLPVGASSDLSHVVLEGRPDGMLPFCEGTQELLVKNQESEEADKLRKGVKDLYAWSTGGSCLYLVNMKGSAGENLLVSKCGATLGQGQDKAFAGAGRGAVSADGSNIFFTAPSPDAEGSKCWSGGSAGSVPEIYARLTEGALKSTIEVSAPEQGVDPSVTYPAVYVGASENGSKVFFLTRTELTKGAEKLRTHEPELYECEIFEEAGEGKCRLTRISGGKADGVIGSVRDVPAISSDGSVVYFNAEGEVTPGVEGGLYRYETETGELIRVAPMQSYPTETTGTGRWYNKEVKLEEVAGLDVEANWYTTSDGQFLVFASSEDLEGYDTGGQIELYRYDYDAEGGHHIVCVSCDPNGAAPSVGSAFARSAVNLDNPSGHSPRPISEDGSYVFFDTAESLVPQATNGKVDVYEWHEDPESHVRTVSLIGSGEGSSNSFFLDSSETGSNVFFGTHARLVPQDTDSEGDLYDARICEPANGNPCIKPPASEAGQCEGDACQSPSPTTIVATPSTLTVTGVGNVTGEGTPEQKPKAMKSKPKKRHTKKKTKKTEKSKNKPGRTKSGHGRGTVRAGHTVKGSRRAGA
jgi:hypothetical protein